MKTLQDFADALSSAKAERRVSATNLASKTGLTPLAVRRILSGDAAPRLTNAMALAGELGLELILVPKGAAQSLSTASEGERTVLTDIERRLGMTAKQTNAS